MAELIVALDVSSACEAEAVVKRLGATVSFYKIGLELFAATGPEVVARVKGQGKRVFLDLKLHDIPRTVERTVKSCGVLGVDLLTIHSSGGRAMIRAAAEAAASFGSAAPCVVAVTCLTSLDQQDLTDLGIGRPMPEQVAALGSLAVGAGAQGIVCSPQEVAAMRRLLGPAALLVTPGVRPAGADVGDQKRVATPAQAVRDGSTHLVVGRPILDAVDPCAAAQAITADMLR
jgi:orotidine-5'-phosphate decarboxylase